MVILSMGILKGTTENWMRTIPDQGREEILSPTIIIPTVPQQGKTCSSNLILHTQHPKKREREPNTQKSFPKAKELSKKVRSKYLTSKKTMTQVIPK